MQSSVLIVTGIYPPDTGGPASFVFEYSQWLEKSGHLVTIITYTNGESRTELHGSIKLVFISRKNGLLVRYFKYIFAVIRSYHPSMSVLAAGGFLEIWSASLIRRFKYVVKIPGDIVWERARNSNKTNLDILEFQSSDMDLKYRIFRSLYSLSIGMAERIIVPSKMLGCLVADWVGNSLKINLVYNSINPAAVVAPSYEERKFDVLTVCRLVPWKGVAELIRACNELNLTLAIAGEGPEKSNLENLARDLGAPVTFLGQVTKDQMREIYALSNTFVLNSSYEGLPHALIEAKANGMLCIARAGTGSEEVITDMKDGLLLGGEMGGSLSIVLKFALSNQLDRNKICAGALEDVRNRFDQETNFKKILKVLLEP